MKTRKTGFTLVEIIAVLIILGSYFFVCLIPNHSPSCVLIPHHLLFVGCLSFITGKPFDSFHEWSFSPVPRRWIPARDPGTIPVLNCYKNFVNCNRTEILKTIAISWIEGSTYYELFQILIKSKAKRKAKTQLRNYKIEDLVDMCENGLSYEGSLVLGAVVELLQATSPFRVLSSRIPSLDTLIARHISPSAGSQYLLIRTWYLPTPFSITRY